MGLDVGDKTGVAISDPLLFTAQGLLKQLKRKQQKGYGRR